MIDRSGAEFLKVYSKLSAESYQALIEEAQRLYVRVEGHALVRDLATNRVWQSPTLIVWEARIREADPNNANDPRLTYLPGWMRDFWRGKVAVDGNDKSEAVALNKRRHQFNMDRLREMHAGGVPILAGSHSPLPYILPGWSLHEELALYVEAGLSPIEALRTATSNVGIFLERTDVGRIRQGALADLLILTANPIRDINSTRQIDSIVINGTLVDSRARAEGFERAKSFAAASSVAGPMIAAFKRGGLDAALPVYEQHCQSPRARMDCTGINAVEFGLAPVLSQSPEKSRMNELVAWAERTFSNQVDVQTWAGLQYRKSGDMIASRRVLEKALVLAPGDPFILHHLDRMNRN